ncbi:MAG: hypothetical protein ABIA93_05910 [Candidatus Woesearchaeota archaeon]
MNLNTKSGHLLAVALLGIFVGSIVAPFWMMGILHDQMQDMMPMDARRENYLEMRDGIVKDLLPQSMYRCCLETPCTYCIEKTPGHGEGATCDCLNDLVNGRHPCGECIGEILEGHGNKYLSEYFAKAIAEEVGESHLQELKLIIHEKYGIPVEEQA